MAARTLTMAISAMTHRSCPQYTAQTESLGLPIADAVVKADVHYLFKPQTFDALYKSPLYYLQEIRSLGNVSNSQHTIEYSRCEPEFASSLSAAIQPFQFDAIVCVPTNRPCLQHAYREAILRISPDAVDYTPQVRRINPNYVGTTLDERVNNLQIDIETEPADLRLLIIDDVLTTGLSSAALMRRFQLSCAGACSFRLTFPLWIQKDMGRPMRQLLDLVKQMPNYTT